MVDKKITLADIFLDILAKSQDKNTKLMSERIRVAIKSPEISELVNVCVTNALGYKTKIKTKTVNDALDGIITFVHSEIDESDMAESDKEKEKSSYQLFAKELGKVLIEYFRKNDQLI